MLIASPDWVISECYTEGGEDVVSFVSLQVRTVQLCDKLLRRVQLAFRLEEEGELALTQVYDKSLILIIYYMYIIINHLINNPRTHLSQRSPYNLISLY